MAANPLMSENLEKSICYNASFNGDRAVTNDEAKTRYQVEYLDWAKGERLMNKRKGDDDNPGLWDYVDQGEITVYKPFASKDAARTWAQKNTNLDVFNMPRIREETLTLHNTDDRGRLVAPWLSWDRTGYWEVDGGEIVEVET
jgi:hypothetical protein